MPAAITDKTLIENLINDFNNGVSKNDICKKYNLSPPTVRNLIKKNSAHHFSRIPQVTIDEISKLLLTAKSKSEISEKLAIDKHTVNRVMKKFNWEISKNIKGPSNTKIRKIDKFKSLYPKDLLSHLLDENSLYKVTQITGYSDALIKKAIKDYNLDYLKKIITTADISDDVKLNIITDYSNMMAKINISKKYNISTNIINSILKCNNVQPPEKELNVEYLKYNKLVRRLTTVVKRFFNLNTPAGYHWDHKISIHQGFAESIPAYIIASRENLELVPSSVNLSKGTNSSITKEELINSVFQCSP